MTDQTPGTPETTAAATEPKEVTRTQNFQIALQSKLSEIIGKKISRDSAWKIFKECIDTTVVFVATDPEKKLPLSGVGTFQIRMSPPRNPVTKAGETPKESKYKDVPLLPRFKFKPSERYRVYLLEELCGIKPEKAVDDSTAETKLSA